MASCLLMMQSNAKKNFIDNSNNSIFLFHTITLNYYVVGNYQYLKYKNTYIVQLLPQHLLFKEFYIFCWFYTYQHNSLWNAESGMPRNQIVDTLINFTDMVLYICHFVLYESFPSFYSNTHMIHVIGADCCVTNGFQC